MTNVQICEQIATMLNIEYCAIVVRGSVHRFVVSREITENEANCAGLYLWTHFMGFGLADWRGDRSEFVRGAEACFTLRYNVCPWGLFDALQDGRTVVACGQTLA